MRGPPSVCPTRSCRIGLAGTSASVPCGAFHPGSLAVPERGARHPSCQRAQTWTGQRAQTWTGHSARLDRQRANPGQHLITNRTVRRPARRTARSPAQTDPHPGRPSPAIGRPAPHRAGQAGADTRSSAGPIQLRPRSAHSTGLRTCSDQVRAAGQATRSRPRAAELRAIRRVNRPRLRSTRRAQLTELVSEPAPRISCQPRIPDPRAGLMTQELRMVVRDPERPRRVGKTIKQVGAPQRPVHGHELRRRLATPARMRRQLPQLDPDAVLHGGISQVDLEPVPDDNRSARQGENVLHGRLQQDSALPPWPAPTSRTGAGPAPATAIVAHPPAATPSPAFPRRAAARTMCWTSDKRHLAAAGSRTPQTHWATYSSARR